MTPSKTRAVYDKANLGTADAARLFKTNRSTIKRDKQSGASGTRAILLRLLASGKITIQDVEQAHD